MSRNAAPQKDPDTGTWWFIVDIGLAADGRRRQARRRGFPTKKAAQVELARLRVNVQEQTFVAPDRLTLAEYLAWWLEGLATAGRRQSTIASYRRHLRLHVTPRLGGIRLQALTSLHLDRLYSELLADGRRDGAAGGLAPRTVRYVATVLGKALSDAQRKKLVAHNVAKDADPPSAKSSKAREMAWWTPDQLHRFLEAVDGEDLLPLFRLAAMTGLRRGEVCGLRWSDLDLDAGQLQVRQQLLSIEHVLTFVEHPKTDHGRRTVDLDPETVTVLRRHRKAQLEHRLAVGPGFVDHGLVFAKLDGAPVHPEAVVKVFLRRVARTDLPRLRFHDLRHSHAAHLIAARQDILVISKRLGHASTSFTYDRYGHLMPKADSGAAVAVADLVDGSRRTAVTNL